MASSAEIQAGKAFVRLFLKNDLASQLSRALKSAGSKLQNFGRGVIARGAMITGAGAAILAPLTAAVKSFADTGDTLDKMSQRTGVAASSLAELGFAAEQSGASLGQVEATILKMNRRFGRVTAGAGTANQISALEELGLSVDQLRSMDAEGRFMAIGEAVAQYGDDAAAAGLAQRVFGTGIDAVLPLLKQGKEGIEALRAEARELGIIPTQEEVDNAAKVTDAINRVRRVVKAMIFDIGASLVEPSLNFLNSAKRVGGAIKTWIKNNGELIRTAAKVGAGLVVAGAALAGLGTAAIVAGFAIGGLATAVSAIVFPLHLLIKVAGAAGAMLKFALGGALGIVKSAFLMTAGIIKGGFTVTLWGLKTALAVATTGFHLIASAVTVGRTAIVALQGALAVVTTGFHALVSAVTVGINTMVAMSGAVASFVALAPVAIIVALTGALWLAWSAASKLSSTLSTAGQGIKNGFDKTKQAIVNVGKAAGDAAVGMGAKLRDSVVAGADAAKRALWKLVEDGKAGFRHLVADIGGSWQTLRDLIAAGDMAEAWSLTLSVIKLEWVRFKQWLVELWAGIKPTVDVAITNVADKLGSILASLKIAWGDIWDGLQEGLKTFLKVLDKAMDSARKYIAMTEGFFGRDPVAAASKAKKYRGMEEKERAAAANLREKGQGGRARQWDDLAKLHGRWAREQEKIVKDNAWLKGGAASLELLAPGARTEKEKATEDAAAREQGKAVAAGVKGAMTVGEKTLAEKEAETAAKKEELAGAVKAHAAALASATKAAKTAREQKEIQGGGVSSVVPGVGAGGKPAGAKPVAAVPAGVALTATYSAAAASISGYQPGGGPEEKMADGTAENTKQMLIKMCEWLKQNETLQSIIERFMAGWKVN